MRKIVYPLVLTVLSALLPTQSVLAQNQIDANTNDLIRIAGETWWFDNDNSGNAITVTNINGSPTPDGALPGWAWTQSRFMIASNAVVTEVSDSDVVTNYNNAVAGDIVRQTALHTNRLDRTIGSLITEAELRINDGSTLTVDQGGVLYAGGNHQIRSTSGGGFLTSSYDSGSGTNELYLISGSSSGGNSHIVGNVVITDNGKPTRVITDGWVQNVTGQIRFDAANTYSGGTVINRLRCRGNNPQAYGTGPVIVNDNNGQAWLTNASAPFQNDFFIAGQGWQENSGLLGAIRMPNNTRISGDVTLTADARITPWDANSFAYIDGDILGGSSVTLESWGNGTLQHNGSQLDVGTVSITRGGLQLGSAGAPAAYTTAPGAINVAAGTRLQGFGNIPSLVTVDGSLIVGTDGSAGELTFDGLTFNPGSSILVDLLGETHDVANVTTLISSNTVIDVNLSGLTTNGVYTIINYDAAASGIVTNWARPTSPVGRKTIELDTSTPGQVNLVIGGNEAPLTWAPLDTANLWDTGISTNWILLTTQTVYQALDSVRIDDSGANTNETISLVGALSPAMVTVDISTNYTFGGAGNIVGTTDIIKAGTGTLTIANNNGFSGDVLITEGMVVAGNGNALGNKAGGTEVSTNATLEINGQDLGAEPIAIIGNGTAGQGAIVNNGANNINATEQITMIGDATVGGNSRWDIRGPAGATYLSTGGNPYNLTKVGNGQFSLVGAAVDQALGDIFVEGGTFSYETSSSGMGDPKRSITFTNTTTFQLWAIANPADKNFIFHDGTRIRAGSGLNTIAGPVDLVGGQVNFQADAGLIMANTISGAGGINKTGGNITYLTAPNTYSGGTTVSAGTLWVGRNSPEGDLGTGPVTLATGNLRIDRSTPSVITNTISGDGRIELFGTQIVELGSVTLTNRAADGIYMGFNAGGTPTLDLTTNKVVQVNRLFLGENPTFAARITQRGGQLSVLDATDPEGPFRIGHWSNEISVYDMSGGELFVPNGRVSLGIDGTGIWNMSGGTATVNRIEVNGRSNTGDGELHLSGGELALGAGGIVNEGVPYTVTFGGGVLSATTNYTVTVDIAATNTTLINPKGHDIALSGAITGDGGFNIMGEGKVTFSGSNAYTGITDVVGTTLEVNGIHTNAGPYRMGTNSYYTGTGTIFGSATFAGAGLGPGSGGPGITTINGNLGMGPGSFVMLDVATNAFDMVAGVQALELTTGVLIRVTGNLTEAEYGVIQYGTRTGEFVVDESITSQGYQVEYDDAAGMVFLRPATVATGPMLDITTLANDVVLAWDAETGQTYAVQISTNVVVGPWVTIQQGIRGASPTLFTNEPPPGVERTYYRVIEE